MRQAIRDLMQRELTDDERRHPWDILLDAVHRLDVAMVKGTFDSDAAYLEHVAVVVRMCKLLVESKAIETISLAYANYELAGKRAVDALEAGLGVVLDAVPDPQREALRRRALDAMHATLVGAAPHDVPPAIEPGPAAVLRAEVERESTVDTRDDGEDPHGA